METKEGKGERARDKEGIDKREKRRQRKQKRG